MVVDITRGTQVRRPGTFQSTESLSASTSTATRTVSVTTDNTDITGSTATVTNYYTLDAGTEGQFKTIRYTATAAGGDGTSTGGDVQILATSWRFTSSVTFRAAGQYVDLRYMSGAWQRVGGNTLEEHWASATSLTGPGATGDVPLTVDTARFNGVTGTDQVYTLADGYEGQEITLFGPTGTTARTITPANMHHWTSVEFGNAAAGGAKAGTDNDAVMVLKFLNGQWAAMSPNYQISSTTTATDSIAIPSILV